MSKMVEISEKECPSCHILYWITEAHNNRLISSKESFYCPNGHGASYDGISVKQRLADKEQQCKKLMIELQETKDDVFDNLSDLSKKEIKIKKLKKEVEKYKNILCPNCKKNYLLSEEERANLICKKCKVN